MGRLGQASPQWAQVLGAAVGAESVGEEEATAKVLVSLGEIPGPAELKT